MLDRLGIERCIIVQPSLYGRDNRCTLDAIAHFGLSRARGVAVTRKDVTPAEIRRLHQAGMRGLRFFLIVDDFVLEDLAEMAGRIAPFDWHVQVQNRGDWLPAAIPILEHWPHPHHTPGNKPEEADCLDVLLDWIPDETTRNAILVDNPAVLYGFDDK